MDGIALATRRGACALALVLAPAVAAQDAWTGPDKARHFVFSAFIASALTRTACDPGPLGRALPLEGPVLALLAGAAKEAADGQFQAGAGSWRDMAWNLLGALAGMMLVKSGLLPEAGAPCLRLEPGRPRLAESLPRRADWSAPLGGPDGRPLRVRSEWVVYDGWQNRFGELELAARLAGSPDRGTGFPLPPPEIAVAAALP